MRASKRLAAWLTLGACMAFACQCEKPPQETLDGGCQQAGAACTADTLCCGSASCVEGSCVAVCAAQGESCTSTSDCCAGGNLSCTNGACACGRVGATCGSSGDCCTGEQCISGACTIVACGSICATCTQDADCCSGEVCTNGACSPGQCGQAGTTCSTTSDCCTSEGLSCVSGVCNSASCEGVGSYCATDNNCCQPGEFCNNDVCTSCTVTGSCSSNSDCCSGSCDGGSCVDCTCISPCTCTDSCGRQGKMASACVGRQCDGKGDGYDTCGVFDFACVDAGPDAGDDAGPPDAGDAGPFVIPDGGCALSVASNPNNVVSAVATVSWAAGIESIQVTVTTADAGTQTTPVMTVSDAGSSRVPVLPLRAATTYNISATCSGAGGASSTTAASPFTTGPLPSGMPSFDISGTSSSPYTLVANVPASTNTVPQYVTIIDGTGTPVWYLDATRNFQSLVFQQQPDFTFTIAENPAAMPDRFFQVDELGNLLRTWQGQQIPDASVTGTDQHELRLQPNGDALTDVELVQQENLTDAGGPPDAKVLGNALERITEGGQMTFCWNGFDYLSVADTDQNIESLTSDPVDFMHLNSIDVMVDGNYLASFRNLSQIIKIDSTDGSILWKLGGKNGQFTFVDDPLGGFSGQHGARELANGDIIIFDDGNDHSPQQSRAVEYQLDTTAWTATLVWSSEHAPPVFSFVMGYADRLPNGDTLIAYGTTKIVQEVDPSGSAVLWTLIDQTPGDLAVYRAYGLEMLAPLQLQPN